MRKLILIISVMTIGVFMADSQTRTPKKDTVKQKTVTVTRDSSGKQKVEKEKEVNRKRDHKKNINEK
jgi:uncharacterized membrane protein